LELPDGNRIETNDWQREVWAHFDDRGLTCGNAVLL
jgi:hypothetical protein